MNLHIVSIKRDHDSDRAAGHKVDIFQFVQVGTGNKYTTNVDHQNKNSERWKKFKVDDLIGECDIWKGNIIDADSFPVLIKPNYKTQQDQQELFEDKK